jgi:hypothetical protein
VSDKPKQGGINESTIARIAGNVASGCATKIRNQSDAEDIAAWSVIIARAIAAEVERTRQKEQA